MEYNYDQYGRCDPIIEKFDMFGASPPTFTLKGKKKVKTAVGLCFTIIGCILLLTFTIMNFEKMLNRKGQVISFSDVSDYHSTENSAIGLTDFDFQLAFAAYSHSTDASYMQKDDMSKVQWYV